MLWRRGKIEPIAGLTIGERDVKFARFSLDPDKNLRLVAYGSEQLPAGSLDSGRIKDAESLLIALRHLRQKHQLTDVITALPAEQVQVFSLSLPVTRADKIRPALARQLEQELQRPLEQIAFDYEIKQAPQSAQGSFLVNVFVLPRELIFSYQTILEQAGLNPRALEIETHSLARSLLPTNHQQVTLLVDLGQGRVNLIIAHGRQISLVRTLTAISGDQLTTLLQRHLGSTYPEAEALKIKHGLARTQRPDVFYGLLPMIAGLKDEIGQLLGDGKAEQIVLCGDQASLPALADYLAANLRRPVAVGNPWVNIYDFIKQVPPLAQHEALGYGTAIGLAFRPWQRN